MSSPSMLNCFPKLGTYNLLLLSALLVMISCDQQPANEQNKKPNILFIFSDDQHSKTINHLGNGNDQLITPNLDKLAKHGLNFSNSFNMGGWNGAVCVASRSMMFTGKTIWKAREADSKMRTGNYNSPFLSELLEAEGYETYMSGKWHIAKSADSVFNHVKHVRPGMPNQTQEGYNRPRHINDTTWTSWDQSKGGFWKGGKHWSEVLAADAIGFIDKSVLSEQPFFMYLAFNAPHDPRQSPKRFVDKYPLEEIELPENFMPEYPYKEAMGSGKNLRDEQLAPFPRTAYAIKVHRQEYFASISHMDEQIGKILNALNESGQLDNTYIIFASDHGLAVGEHGLMGKQSMYDHSIKTPLIISGPNIPQDLTIDPDVYVQDIMPTILEIAGVKKPDFVDFNSLVPLINGEQDYSYASIYGCYTMSQRMIRSGGFKLIAYPKANKLRLFDLKNDPFEKNDLIENQKYQSIKEKLWKDLLVLQKEMKDTLDLAKYISG